MGFDMVVALNQADVQGCTLFGLNYHGAHRHRPVPRRFVAAVHAPDEVLRFGDLHLPQVRRTCTVLGMQPAETWGLTHGINEHRVVAGFCRWQSKLAAENTGLTGADLVRLTLERSQSARQALDVVTDLVCRHGQRSLPDGDDNGDCIFLVADAREAFVVETAGRHWASLECRQTRAVSDVGLIRQDWRRLSPGLAEQAISRGWWADDGSKLDLAGCLAVPTAQTPWALKRWGKATLQLEQQHGHIDAFFLRRMLCDHFDASARTSPTRDGPTRLLGSFLAVLPADARTVPMAWYAFGSGNSPLFLPLLIPGDLPAALDPRHARPSPAKSFDAVVSRVDTLLSSAERSPAAREVIDRLQARIDLETDEFVQEARELLVQGNNVQVARLAGVLMQRHWELLEAEEQRTQSPREPATVGQTDTAVFAG